MAFYGEKPEPLATLMAGVQALAASHLPGFRPRPLPEVHATLIGLEHPTRKVTDADLPPFVRHLRTSLDRAGMIVQFGGFADGDHPIRSRGRSLYERSFLVSEVSVVLIGWPVDAGGRPASALDTLRRSCQDFGFRHRYHARPGDQDPDCYLVIGQVPDADPARVAAGEAAIRDELAAAPPVRVALGLGDVRFVRYKSTTLAAGTSKAHPIDQMSMEMPEPRSE
ncbi:hypothetical protein J2S43_000636 [Catenuloplanes nepalensis]|uniref:2'-5' RNA ligase n=1 Tax=Catenuloplanes nepalensis TaxID=587533 RepID=A0ABT9ML39_9ACTN|nr:hypothetical protein [Catenuloplanes nepalensis]MDP9792124.1 hypothetical protein [Catenuloplanes nepalensis]